MNQKTEMALKRYESALGRHGAAPSIITLLAKPYLNEIEVHLITGRALPTLRNDRHRRRGIPYLKVGGRSVRYRLADVIEFMEARPIAF